MSISAHRLQFWISAILALSTIPTQAVALEKPVRIVALGDSTTFGYGMKKPYPHLLAEQLAEAGIPAVVINSGINGDTSERARERFDRDVLARSPNLVIIQFGLNDQTIRFYSNPAETSPYTDIPRFIENHAYFVEGLRKRGIPVILMTPNPMVWTPALAKKYPKGPFIEHPDGGNRRLERYVEVLRLFARDQSLPLVDIYRDYQNYGSGKGQSLEALFLDDGVHPNEEAYRRNTRLILPLVLKTLNLTRSKVGTAGRRALPCITNGKLLTLSIRGIGWREAGGYLELYRVAEPRNPSDLFMIPLELKARSFRLQARLQVQNSGSSSPSLVIDDTRFQLKQDGKSVEATAVVSNKPLSVRAAAHKESPFFKLEMTCRNGAMKFSINGQMFTASAFPCNGPNVVTFDPGKGAIRFQDLRIRVEGNK